MNAPDKLIQRLRASGRFVFTFPLADNLPEDRLRAQLKIHFEKAMDAYFQNQPSLARYKNEVERY